MENSKNDFDSFLSYLEKACKRVDNSYFELKIADSEWKYRERVYCYELYHQLRCVLEKSFLYKLNGEVSKAGHPIIQKTLGAKIPDFIMHVSGEMDKNLVVVEVKSATAIKEHFKELEKDLEKLKRFLNEANYKNAIMLIYGECDDDLLQKIKGEFKNIEIEKEKQMLLILHQRCGEKPIVIDKNDI